MKSSKFQIGDRVKWEYFEWCYGTVVGYKWSHAYKKYQIRVLMDPDKHVFVINERYLALIESAIDKLNDIL